MSVIGRWTSTISQIFVPGLQGMVGSSFFLAIFDRGGGVQCNVTCSEESLNSIISEVQSIITLPDDVSARRSAYLWYCVIPEGVESSPTFFVDVRDSSDNPVDVSLLAFALDEGEEYTLYTSAGEDSGAGTVNEQSTGLTPIINSDSAFVLAVETTRGATSADWDLTTNTPENPSDPSNPWELSIGSGSGTAQRRGSVGYLSVPTSTNQSWSDTVSYGTAVLASAFIVVGAKDSSFPETTLSFDIEFPELEGSFYLEDFIVNNLEMRGVAPTLKGSFSLETIQDSGDYEPILVGDGSFADRMMQGLISQGFFEGTLADRERARLLAKLGLTQAVDLSIQDLYWMAEEPNRLGGQKQK